MEMNGKFTKKGLYSNISRRHFKEYFFFEITRIAQYRISIILLKLLRHVVHLAIWFFFLPITIILHFYGIRRVTVFTDRIGHLAIEPDCLLKSVRLGMIPDHHYFFLAPPKRVSNSHLLYYWAKQIPCFQNVVVCFFLHAMSRWIFMKFNILDYIASVNHPPMTYLIYSRWKRNKPIIALDSEDLLWGRKQLRKMGVPEDCWYACVHVRESGFSPIDEAIQSHRNGTIDMVIPAITEITDRGGWVIRIGDGTMEELRPMPQVIDYAHHPMKSERLDVVLAAMAKFTLGNSSGIAFVSTIFGVPCAIANMIPVFDLWFGPKDLTIPKLLWSHEKERYLNFDELISSPISCFKYAGLYIKENIRLDENSEEDISDLVIEMIERLANDFTENSVDRGLQEKYKELYQNNSFSALSCSQIATSFLRRYNGMLI